MKSPPPIFFILAFGLALAGGAQGQQATREQGDWPCRQIKVPRLSIESVWTGPAIGDAAKSWRDDPELSELVARLAARRTPIEAAERLVADFAKAAGEKRRERLTALFAGVFAQLDAERGEVIAGLDRYGRMQKEMAEKARLKTQELRDQQDKRAASEKIAELSEALQWDLRLFEERRKAVAFVCETPALIEQRLGALARAIAGAMQ